MSDIFNASVPGSVPGTTEGTSEDGGMSAEAIAFLRDYPVDGPTLDLDDVVAYRKEARRGFQPAIDRAIERHALDLEEVVLGGVHCLRVQSQVSGSANGSMLYFYGGGFVVGDPETDLVVSGHLAAACGVEVYSPRYRLAPEHPFPAGFDDCWASYEALTADQGPCLLAGESAGGNLALLVAQSAVSNEMPLPRAMALLSPAADLRLERDLFVPVDGHDPTLNLAGMTTYMAAYIDSVEADPTSPAVSPIFGSMDQLPPTIMTTGTRDQLSAMVLRLDRQMRRAGVDVDTRVWDGLWHVFEYYDDYPEAAESLDDIAEFLNKH